MRLFVAIPLEEQTTAELVEAVARVREALLLPNLHWSPPESWHITLQFLGSVKAVQYSCVVGRLRSVCLSALTIAPKGIGAFERAGVLYADVKPSAELIALQKRVVEESSGCGFLAEERPYHPHITLARSRARRRLELSPISNASGGPEPFKEFTAREFVLYESVPKTPACYVIRERFAFAQVGSSSSTRVQSSA